MKRNRCKGRARESSRSRSRTWGRCNYSSESEHDREYARPGNSSLEVHRNLPEKRALGAEKSPGTVKTALQSMICAEIVSWASKCRDAAK